MSKIKRFRGDTYSIEATLTKDSTPVDFTGGNNTAKLSFIRGSVGTTIDGINGDVDGNISFPFPADVKAGMYDYDIQVISNTGEIRTYIKSTLEITSDVTV